MHKPHTQIHVHSRKAKILTFEFKISGHILHMHIFLRKLIEEEIQEKMRKTLCIDRYY